MASNEILLGEFPEADGSDYDPNSYSISFFQIYTTMEEKGIENARVAIVGRVQYGKGRYISGVSAKFNRQEIINASKGKGTYEQKMQRLFGLNQTPIHITGVSIKPL